MKLDFDRVGLRFLFVIITVTAILVAIAPIIDVNYDETYSESKPDGLIWERAVQYIPIFSDIWEKMSYFLYFINHTNWFIKSIFGGIYIITILIVAQSIDFGI